jgi:hypothetical protein
VANLVAQLDYGMKGGNHWVVYSIVVGLKVLLLCVRHCIAVVLQLSYVRDR